MLRLYRFHGATCAAKVLMALHEKALPFEDIVLERAELSQDWYRRLNPAGVVPTLLDGEMVLTESTVILNYLDDAFPDHVLRPADPVARARMNHWMKTLDDALIHLGTVTYAIASRHRYLGMGAAEREAVYVAIPDAYVRHTRREAIEMGLAGPGVRSALVALRGLVARADADVRRTDFLTGEFSLADISLITFVWRMDALRLLPENGRYPDFDRWRHEVEGRDSYRIGVAGSAPSEVTAGLRAAGEREAEAVRELLRA